MKIDLRDIGLNDKVFTLWDGTCHVTNIYQMKDHFFSTHNYNFNFNGINRDSDLIYPTCFHSIEECIEYFQSVKKEMDEESNPKKRYWLWSTKNKGFCSGGWIKRLKYYDDNGYTTTGHLFGMWDEMEKIKHENEFIDV